MTPSLSATSDRLGLGIFYAVVGIAFMALFDTLAKLLGEGYGIVQLVFFRNLFGLAFVLLLIWRQQGGFAQLRSRQSVWHGLRALFGLGASFSFFIGLQYMALAEAFAITFAGPIFITALSVPLLREKVGIRRWAAVLVGLIGVLWILRPGAGAFRLEGLLPLTAALCYAFVMLIGRRLSREDSPLCILFWPSLIGMLATAVALPFDWLPPTPGDWALFVFLGVMGSLTMLFMTLAYRNAPAAVVAPFDYSILLWGLLWGWIFWQELPDPGIWPGASLLIACGLYIIFRETRRPPALPRDSAPPADR